MARAGELSCPGARSTPADVHGRTRQLRQRRHVPVTSNAFGMSAFGAYNMAGNVKEWTLNDSSKGLLATGGAWGDPGLRVRAVSDSTRRFFSSAKLGFRCALERFREPRATRAPDRIELTAEIPSYKASSVADFEKWRALYDYNATPLDARVEGVVETDDWRRERITFAGRRLPARDCVPLSAASTCARPLQVVHLCPPLTWSAGLRCPAGLD